METSNTLKYFQIHVHVIQIKFTGHHVRLPGRKTVWCARHTNICDHFRFNVQLHRRKCWRYIWAACKGILDWDVNDITGGHAPDDVRTNDRTINRTTCHYPDTLGTGSRSRVYYGRRVTRDRVSCKYVNNNTYSRLEWLANNLFWASMIRGWQYLLTKKCTICTFCFAFVTFFIYYMFLAAFRISTSLFDAVFRVSKWWCPRASVCGHRKSILHLRLCTSVVFIQVHVLVCRKSLTKHKSVMGFIIPFDHQF